MELRLILGFKDFAVGGSFAFASNPSWTLALGFGAALYLVYKYYYKYGCAGKRWI